ncbi:hypothetical protein QAD02_018247 [Eretmocerus hayati]|uniref:Uncharacterized protein n=1 Tax=Eretmocerus hayati TaxID=131215 RepID=A0ACC2PL14_9HYME|nr:hypothetical protein QAD02_018247 [Eretmocerus hayati]
MGIIISKSHVIAKTLSSWESGEKCRFTVLSRTNARGDGGERHGANITKIGDRAELSLFKLRHPIKIGPRAQVIPVAAKRPEQGAEVLFISWIRDMGGKGVTAIKATVAEQNICQSFLSGNNDRIDETKFFCTNGFKNPCPGHPDPALIYNGQLVGIESSYYQPTPTSNEWIYRYYDLSLYRDTIMRLIGDM